MQNTKIITTTTKTAPSQKVASRPKQKRKKNQPSIGVRSVANIRAGGLGQQPQRFQAPVAMGTIVGGNTRREVNHVGPRREYIADVLGNTVAFGLVASLPINPGQATFPWLKQTALNYDMYRFTRLRFVYINRTTTANTGEVTMVFDPDPTDAAPANDLQALQYEAMKPC